MDNGRSLSVISILMNYWDPGETLQVTAVTLSQCPQADDMIYFQFVLPNGIWRSNEFTAS